MIDYETFCKIRCCHDRQGLTLAQKHRSSGLDAAAKAAQAREAGAKRTEVSDTTLASSSMTRCAVGRSKRGFAEVVDITPGDGGTVQAILILPSKLPVIVSPSAPGLWRRLPQLAGADPAVNVVRQEPVLMVHEKKDGAKYE